MMGRAGRPQFDQHGKAVILVHEPKKSFYKKVKLNWNYLAIFSILCNNLPQKIIFPLNAVLVRTIPRRK